MKIFFFGGLSRAGKAAFWPLLSGIKGLDQPQNLPQLDWYNSAYESGDISEDTFLRFIELEIKASSWFSYIGRYLNSNENDLTNFQRLTSAQDYAERVKRKDTDTEYNRFHASWASNKFVPVFTTDIKITAEQQSRLDFEIIHVHVIRNPIRMYNEWMDTNRVVRSQEVTGRMIKYASKRKLTQSVEDTTAKIILDDFDENIDGDNTIKFEDLCIDPLGTVQSIAERLDLPLNVIDKRKLDDARVPRAISDSIDTEIAHSYKLSKTIEQKLQAAQTTYFNML